jgi:hypothetical protein
MVRPSLDHGKMQSLTMSRVARRFVAGFGVSCDTDTGIIGQYALNASCGSVRSISNNHLTRMQRVANADAAAVVE